MSARQVFTVPPNWPQPPAGWSPPPGWQPDPAWGPAPDGWDFWRRPAHRPPAAVVAVGTVTALLVLGGIAAAAAHGDPETRNAPVAAPAPRPSLSPSPSPTHAAETPAPATTLQAPAARASTAPKPVPVLDAAAVSACVTFGAMVGDVVTKQDRSDLGRAVNVHARDSSEPQIVDAGGMLTDHADSFTGFMWDGAKAVFADVCLRGGIEGALAARDEQGGPAGGDFDGTYTDDSDSAVEEVEEPPVYEEEEPELAPSPEPTQDMDPEPSEGSQQPEEAVEPEPDFA